MSDSGGFAEGLNEEFFNKSFQAMWYQAEVLHKREMDTLKEIAEKQEKERVEDLKKSEETTKDMIYQFSKDIIATFKDMREFEETRLEELKRLLLEVLFFLNPKGFVKDPDPSPSPVTTHDSDEEDDVPSEACLLGSDLLVDSLNREVLELLQPE